jgi:transglutaminase-like putative cysteine protease
VRFDIRYETEYVYAEPVSDSLNALRVKPTVTSTQEVETWELRVDPEVRVQARQDYFGTDVLEFGIVEPHDRMAIVAHATVLTEPGQESSEAAWPEPDDRAYRRGGREFLLVEADPLPPEDAILELLEAVRRPSPLASAHAVTEVIPDRFEYRQGSTFVGSTVEDLLEGGAGVCQDFVHLAVILLRRLGIGARYVSGYLFAAPDGGGRDSVEVLTHAWLEALIPEPEREPRWLGFDPTNGGRAVETHVKIGHGRNYQDVPPIRGVYKGPSATEVVTRVRMTRVNGNGAGAG